MDPLAKIDLSDMEFLNHEPNLLRAGANVDDDLLDTPYTITPPINVAPRKGDTGEEKFTLRAIPTARIEGDDTSTPLPVRSTAPSSGPPSRSSAPTARNPPGPPRSPSPSRMANGGIYKSDKVRVAINGFESKTVASLPLKNVWNSIFEAAEKDFRDQLEPLLITTLPHVISTKQLDPTQKRLQMERIKEIQKNLNQKVGNLKKAAAAAVRSLDAKTYQNYEGYLVDVNKQLTDLAWNVEGTDVLKQINDVRNYFICRIKTNTDTIFQPLSILYLK